MTDATSTTDVHYYIGVLRSRKSQVGVVTLLITLGVAFWTFRQTPVYFTQARVQVYGMQNAFASSVAITTATLPDMETEKLVVASQATAAKVHQQLVQEADADPSLRPIPTVKDLLQHVRAVPDGTDTMLVGYTSTNALAARSVAHAFATQYGVVRSERADEQIEAAISPVVKTLTAQQDAFNEVNDKLADPRLDPGQRSSLQSQTNLLTLQIGSLLSQLNNLSAQKGIALSRILVDASEPTAPTSPKKGRNISLALFGGLLLGLGVAYGAESVDNRVKSRDEFERRLGAPVLAVVPRVRSWRKDSEAHLITLEDPRGAVSESYRTLGTNVRYAARKGVKVLTITSAMSGEGKTTTAANLAVVLAQSGRRVILVSADLRRPRLHEFFGASNDRGLADALAGTSNIAEVIVDPGVHGLRLVNSGAPPTDPVALLAGEHAALVFGTMREVADFVIVDAPPTLAVADASILAALSDAAIFVMDGHVSGRTGLAASREQLENSGAAILGGVFNTVDERSGAGYYRYYRNDRYYGSYYGREQSDQPPNGNGHSNGSARIIAKRAFAFRSTER